jgi:hypothetical protein
MAFKRTYWVGAALAVLVIASWAGQAQAVNFVFASGDGDTGACPASNECVAVHAGTVIPDGTGGGGEPNYAATVTTPNTQVIPQHGAWYNPSAAATGITPGNVSLNSFLQTQNGGVANNANWVSFVASGCNGAGGSCPSSPVSEGGTGFPAVPNYCAASIGCTGTDATGHPSIPPPDLNRIPANATAVYSQKVSLPVGLFSYDLTGFAWNDDTMTVQLTGPVNAFLSPDFCAPSNCANPHTGGVAIVPGQSDVLGPCTGDNQPIGCVLSSGQSFSANGLPGGDYTLNFYSFQVGSNVYGALWGGSFVQNVLPPPPPPPPPNEVPEPSTVLLLGSGLAGIGLLRRWRKSA